MHPQDALAHLHKRMADASCDVAPEWASGAKLCVPFTPEQLDELESMGLEMENHHRCVTERPKLVKTTERRTPPDGWEISQKATKHTNLTQERLVHEYTPLPDVLVEFLQDRGDRLTSRCSRPQISAKTRRDTRRLCLDSVLVFADVAPERTEPSELASPSSRLASSCSHLSQLLPRFSFPAARWSHAHPMWLEDADLQQLPQDVMSSTPSAAQKSRRLQRAHSAFHCCQL